MIFSQLQNQSTMCKTDQIIAPVGPLPANIKIFRNGIWFGDTQYGKTLAIEHEREREKILALVGARALLGSVTTMAP